MASMSENFNLLKQRFNEHKLDVEDCVNDNRSAFDKQFTFLTDEVVNARLEFKRKITLLNQCLVAILVVLGIMLIIIGLLILRGM